MKRYIFLLPALFLLREKGKEMNACGFDLPLESMLTITNNFLALSSLTDYSSR